MRVIFSYFLVQSFEVIHQVIKWYRLTINHVQLHILIIGLPLFNNRSRWNYIERRRIKCVIVETTQTYECAAMFHYLTVKLCIIDGTPAIEVFNICPMSYMCRDIRSTPIKFFDLANAS